MRRWNVQKPLHVCSTEEVQQRVRGVRGKFWIGVSSAGYDQTVVATRLLYA
jgi:hypothetical protein